MPTVLTAYYMHKPGGLCARLCRAMEALLEAGHTVHYAGVRPLGIHHQRCHFHELWWPKSLAPRGGLFWAYLHLVMPIQLFALGVRHNVTHTFAFSINYGAMLWPLVTFRRLPYALFLRGDSIRNNRIKGVPGWVLKLEHWLEAAAVNRAVLVGVSSALLNEVVERQGRARPLRAVVLRNDPPTTKWRMPKYDGGRLEIGAVGVLEARKNLRLLVEVMREITDCDARLHFFGSGPIEADLRSEAEHLVDRGQIVFHGWVGHAEIWPRIHLLVHPSVHEGVPNAVLEALAVGGLVLASDIPEHREWIVEELLLPVRCSRTWAEAIRKIADNSDYRADLYAGARRTVQSTAPDWDLSVVQLIAGSPDPQSEVHS